MTLPGERISKVEGILEQILEQINERTGNLEVQISRMLGQKADKSEVRLLFVATLTLLVAITGLLGAILAKI